MKLQQKKIYNFINWIKKSYLFKFTAVFFIIDDTKCHEQIFNFLTLYNQLPKIYFNIKSSKKKN